MGNGAGLTLSKDDFLNQLEREKKRAERSKSPMSIAIFRCKDATNSSRVHLRKLLQLVVSAKRDVDVLGAVDVKSIAIILLDTDKKGADQFLGRIAALSNGTPYSVISGTYPDYVFENLESGTNFIVDLPKKWPDDYTDHNKLQRGLKRIIDVLGASLALILLSPVMLLTAVAVGLSSPGPVVFRQVRVGKGGTAFTIYKFRSMFCNADDRIHRDYVTSLIRKDGESIDDKCVAKSWTKFPYDPRITPVGTVIRKTKLDELPQLFNVLKGDLSLVGPRPALSYEVESYEAWHFRRILRVKPGITGIWQIEGRDDTTFDDMVRMDLWYIRTWSVPLDLKILTKTAMVMFRIGAGERTAKEFSHKGTGKPVHTEA